MKFYSSIITILSAFALFTSCSDNSIIEDNIVPEIVYDATFSLAVKHNEKVETKADGTDISNSYQFIGKLSLAVFQNDLLVAFKEQSHSNGVYGIAEVKVPSGNAKVVLLANVDIAEQYKKIGETTLKDYQAMSVHLDDEINGSLSMSSGILNYSFYPGHNYVGYAKQTGQTTVEHKDGNNGTIAISGIELTGKEIEMIRNVSRVYVTVVYLNPKKEYAGVGTVHFKMKEFFAANVKSESRAIFDQNGTVELNKEEADFWWCGKSHTEEGALKEGAATLKESLYYNVITPPNDFDELNKSYPFVNNDIWICTGNIFGRDDDNVSVVEQSITFNPNGDYTGETLPHIGGYGGGIPLGTYFHVYENKELGNNRTLFVVKGDYTYYPVVEGKNPKVWKDRYYTVVVNKDNRANADHEFVKHNYMYDIALTITGPGSDKPYDPQSTADISAEIKVEDWDVVNQDEPNLE